MQEPFLSKHNREDERESTMTGSRQTLERYSDLAAATECVEHHMHAETDLQMKGSSGVERVRSLDPGEFDGM